MSHKIITRSITLSINQAIKCLTTYIQQKYDNVPNESIVNLINIYKGILDQYEDDHERNIFDLRNYNNTILVFGDTIIWLVPFLSINDLYTKHKNSNRNTIKNLVETSEIKEIMYVSYKIFDDKNYYNNIEHKLILIDNKGKNTNRYISTNKFIYDTYPDKEYTYDDIVKEDYKLLD